MNKLLNKTYIIFFLSFILFGAVIVMMTSFINYKLQYDHIDKDIAAHFALEKSMKLETLYRDLQSLDALAFALASNKTTQDLISEPSPEILAYTENLFIASAKSNPLVTQISFLDKNAKETIRVALSKDGRKISFITYKKFQDKQSHYDFIQASQLRPKQFWHSNLDLNLEVADDEKNTRSTYRVATPVYNKEIFSGLVIVSIDAQYLIDYLTRSADFEEMIINGDGEFISLDKVDNVWNSYLKEKGNFLELFPDVGRGILSEKDLKDQIFYHFSLEREFQNGEKLQLVLLPKGEILSQLTDNNLTTSFILALTVLLVSFPLSWCAGMIPARLQSQLQKTLRDLQSSSAIIDQNVMSCSLNIDGEITRASYAFCLVTGYKLGELLGQPYSLLRDQDSPSEVYDRICNTVKGGKIWRGELKSTKKSGEIFWMDMVLTPQLNLDSEITGYEQISQDITAKKEVEKLSITDEMTQIYNRRKIDLLLFKEMSRFDRFQQIFSVILLDIDHFKRVNDTYGHQIGDKVLISVASSLKENTRDTDCVGRWGGEEFLVVLRGTDINGARIVAEKLRKGILLLDFQPIKEVSASFGIAQSKKLEPLSKLISRVDGALYQAKSNGRNCVSVSATDKESSSI